MGRLKRMIVPGFLVLALYYAVFGGEYSYFELRQARREVEIQRAALIELQGRLDSLQAWADSLREDPVVLERVARERFGLIREGETLYRFAPPPGAAPSEDDPEEEPRG